MRQTARAKDSHSEMTDTPPPIQKLYRELLLARSGEERLKMGCDMFDSAVAIAQAAIESVDDGSSAGERRARLFRRLYAADLDPATVANVVERLSKHVS